MKTSKKRYIFAILGNDKRLSSVSDELSKNGHLVRVIEDIGCSSAELFTRYDKAVSGSDFIILPLPATRDGKHISTLSEKIKLCDIIELSKINGSIILGGLISDDLKANCKSIGVEIIDYYALESIQAKNALPSAEGALMIAMENTDITVKGMNALVCGYGKTGSLLADILRKLGADVTVGARRDETLCELSIEGFKSVRLGDDTEALQNTVKDCDVIFNTVPARIFTKNLFDGLKKPPVYIEIASAPGGIDPSDARDCNINIIFAPSIPSKYAPKTAGLYVFEAISEILEKRGMPI